MGYKESQKKGITSDLDEKEGRQFCRKSLVKIREDKKVKNNVTFYFQQQNKSTRSGDDI